MGSKWVVAALAGVLAGTAAVTVQDAELKEGPDAASMTLKSLAGGTAVVLGERRGGWYAVSVDETAGWLRMLNVRMAGDGRTSGAAGLGALLQVGRSEATVSTGVRGLTAADLQAAVEDRDALARLAAMQPAAEDVDSFADEGRLIPRRVDGPRAERRR
jgi:hypothetical protein